MARHDSGHVVDLGADGAPTGLPHATAVDHHVVATLGIWPLYLTIGGLADVARRARRLYVERDWTAAGAAETD